MAVHSRIVSFRIKERKTAENGRRHQGFAFVGLRVTQHRNSYWHIDDMDCATADEALPICEARVKSLVKTLLAEQKRQDAPARLRRAESMSKIVFGLQRQSRIC